MPHWKFSVLLALLYTTSCSDNSNPVESVIADESITSQLMDFVGSHDATNSTSDFSHFFIESMEVQAENVSDGAEYSQGQFSASDNITRTLSDSPSLSAKDASDHSTKQGSSSTTQTLGPNDSSDEVIKSISKLNEELIEEIRILKGASSGRVVARPLNNQDRQQEMETIKARLIRKTEEINELKQKNIRLEERILKLESQPLNFSLNAPVEVSGKVGLEEATQGKNKKLQAIELLECTLEFDAVVTLQSGKNREALYTEFFLLERSLFDILDEQLDIADYSGLSSYEELWAKARKNPYKFPGVAKRINSYLLAEVSNNSGYRTRTDLNGFARFEHVAPGLYFLVGTASLGTVGVTWNVPVYLRDGTNKTSLTLSNASWRE